MKKSLIIALSTIGLAFCANAQGVFSIDSTANAGDNATPTSTTGGLVFINGVLDTATDINLQLLWGTSSTAVTGVVNMDIGSLNNPASTAWLVSQPTGVGDITYPQSGGITDPNGNVYSPGGLAVGTLVYLIVQGWDGTDTTYAAAQLDGSNVGQSSIFSVTLAAATDVTHIQDMHTMSSLNLTSVPEPTSLALAGLGGLGMLMALRRKQA